MSGTGARDRAADGPGPSAAPASAPWVTVAAGEAVAPPDRPLRTGRIFAQVIALAAIVVVAVALVGAVASRRMAERQSVTDAAQLADLQAEAVVQPALADGLLTGDRQAVANLDRAVRAHVLGPSVVRVKIWTPQGRIVYSDEPRVVGQTFPLDDEEREALVDPTTRAEVSDLRRPENRYEQGQGKLLEVYRPVWTPGGQPLLFETYARYSAVTARAGELWRGFAGITVSSLLFLVVLLLPILWRLLDRLGRAREQREALLQRAVDASDAERRRIAATLHDGVVQELAATSFAVAGAAERAQGVGQPQLADALRGAAGTVRASIGGLRSLLVDIYPPSLRDDGLAAALGDLATSLRSREVAVELDVRPEAVAALDGDGDRLVYRVTQECLRNVARHAAARRVEVRLARADGAVTLDVTDDGVGFDPVAVLARPEEGHFGMRVLADLAASAGAVLRVASAPGAGTRWRLEVPA